MTHTVRNAVLPALLLIAAGAMPALGQTPLQGYVCKKKVSAIGLANPSRPMAELQAIRTWIEVVGKDGEIYSWWHRAQEKSLSCDPVGKVGYYRCTVSAMPCVPMDQNEGGGPADRGPTGSIQR